MLLKKTVIEAYRILLDRDPENEDVIESIRALGGIKAMITAFSMSKEFKKKHPKGLEATFPDIGYVLELSESVSLNKMKHLSHNGFRYRVPEELLSKVNQEGRILLIGQCLLDAWPLHLKAVNPGFICDRVLFNNAVVLPDEPPRPITDYDLIIVNIPLRSIMMEQAYYRLSFLDKIAHQQLYNKSTAILKELIEKNMIWNKVHGKLTFISNFIVPQQNPMGRLLPKYDIRNFVFFVEMLNKYLETLALSYNNTYMLDINEISQTFGKKFIQDDSVYSFNHASVLLNYDFSRDRNRLQPPKPLSDFYEFKVDLFIKAVWAEALAMLRTIQQDGSVKLVIIDLDDTLWRGVIAESGEISSETTEGWPLGIVEALCFLKKRGILLAIVSKNDEGRVASFWERIMRGRLELADFAVRKINWSSKVQNIEQVLKEVNLLPRSVIFIDDNPVERAAVEGAFPDMRVLGSELYYLRRILLWSAETQVPIVTQESSIRTEMTRAQLERDESRTQSSRSDFLASLLLKVEMKKIITVNDQKFSRAFELLNKTNQFNTTGKRWTNEECVAAFASGVFFLVFKVEDRFSVYGLVGVMIVRGSHLEQFVMSCRVLGLDVEAAVLARLSRYVREQLGTNLYATINNTEANFPCRDVFRRCDWTFTDRIWIDQRECISLPPHVEVVGTLL